MTWRTGVIARRLGLVPPSVVLSLLIHVSNGLGYMMAIVADGELWNMRSPCSEARSGFSRSSGSLPSRDTLALKPHEDGGRRAFDGSGLSLAWPHNAFGFTGLLEEHMRPGDVDGSPACGDEGTTQ